LAACPVIEATSWKDIDTFAEHVSIANEYGYVWFGKFGQGVTPQTVERIHAQIASGVETYAYLGFHGAIRYRATLLDMKSAGVKTAMLVPEPMRVPEYYRGEHCGIWFKMKNLAQASVSDQTSFDI
jgi:hypothetical protein